MGTLMVKFLPPQVQGLLLNMCQAPTRCGCPMQSFMRAIVLGMARTTAFQINAQGHPPHRNRLNPSKPCTWQKGCRCHCGWPGKPCCSNNAQNRPAPSLFARQASAATPRRNGCVRLAPSKVRNVRPSTSYHQPLKSTVHTSLGACARCPLHNRPAWVARLLAALVRSNRPAPRPV